MTIEGAIVELQNLIDDDAIPFWAKPSLQKIKETVEDEREERIALQEKQIVWHPYPQEKPKVDGDYNVTLKYSKCTATANYDTENDEWRGGNDFYVPNRCITAWVELPEPYKGSEAK